MLPRLLGSIFSCCGITALPDILVGQVVSGLEEMGAPGVELASSWLFSSKSVPVAICSANDHSWCLAITRLSKPWPSKLQLSLLLPPGHQVCQTWQPWLDKYIKVDCWEQHISHTHILWVCTCDIATLKTRSSNLSSLQLSRFPFQRINFQNQVRS